MHSNVDLDIGHGSNDFYDNFLITSAIMTWLEHFFWFDWYWPTFLQTKDRRTWLKGGGL